MRVSLANSDRSFSADPDRSLLDAALGAGLNLPHGCRGGNCGACRGRLIQGRVHYPNGPPLGLSAAEVAEGLILLCQARAVGDACIEVVEIGSAEAVRVKRLPSRIERAEVWSHDVLGLFLRLPAAEAFHFEPGQYLDILLSGGRRRSFSIASPPHDARLLELHVRRVPGGELTEKLFADAASRPSLLTIEGPLGGFVYRDGRRPLLLVGGGTGLAPLKCMLRHVLDKGLGREVVLYWGVRAERDLYAHALLEDLSRRVKNFRYRAVLSEADVGWPGRRGWVHQAVIDDLGTLEAHDIYASGPPAFIEAVRRDFPAHGADPERLFFDPFDYAPDSLARHRSTADSNA